MITGCDTILITSSIMNNNIPYTGQDRTGQDRAVAFTTAVREGFSLVTNGNYTNQHII